jgi:predicted nucleic acid-binding protein
MPRVFVDSGVLILAARGEERVRDIALRWLEDPQSLLLSSPFVHLEVVPQAAFNHRSLELEFYALFFRHAVSLENTRQIVGEAVGISTRCGVAPMDALHVAAASLLRADLLLTAEKPGKSIYRADVVPVRYYLALK